MYPYAEMYASIYVTIYNNLLTYLLYVHCCMLTYACTGRTRVSGVNYEDIQVVAKEKCPRNSYN